MNARGKNDLIRELAGLLGIASEYYDIWGNRHEPSIQTLDAILTAMAVNTESESSLEKEIFKVRTEEWTRLGPPVLVLYENESRSLPLNVPLSSWEDVDHYPVVELSLLNEAGTSLDHSYTSESLVKGESKTIGDVLYQRYHIEIPGPLPIGYYQCQYTVITQFNNHSSHLRLIICPQKAYIPPFLEGEGRVSGVAAALYGLKSDRNWGIGDFTDLKKFGLWAAHEMKAHTIGLNPLLANLNKAPYHHSPYLPLTRFYRNFIYLDVEKAAGFDDLPEGIAWKNNSDDQKKVHALRMEPEVDYDGVARVKKKYLKRAFTAFMDRHPSDPERENFKNYVRDQGNLLIQFSTFMALDEYFLSQNPPLYGRRNWPEGLPGSTVNSSDRIS